MTSSSIATLSRPYDVLALGEILLRLDPGTLPVRRARSFDVWEGGSEYNVVRALHTCFGMRAAVITSLVRNEVGLLIEDLITHGGVGTDGIIWRDDGGIGAQARNAVTFVGRGFGVRPAIAVADRANSATSQIVPGDVDWADVFGERSGIRWFHTGGVFSALSEHSVEVAELAMRSARETGVPVSYDLSFRASLWRDRGGPAGAQAVGRRLARHADYLFGNEEEFRNVLGIEPPILDSPITPQVLNDWAELAEMVGQEYFNLKGVAIGARSVTGANKNDWSGASWARLGGRSIGMIFAGLDVYDRIGSGDAFASGLIYGVLSGLDQQTALNYGIAHAALVMTTPGDTSMATRDEVESVVRGERPRIVR